MYFESMESDPLDIRGCPGFRRTLQGSSTRTLYCAPYSVVHSAGTPSESPVAKVALGPRLVWTSEVLVLGGNWNPAVALYHGH